MVLLAASNKQAVSLLSAGVAKPCIHALLMGMPGEETPNIPR